MTCREFWDRMPELEAGRQPLDHVRGCPRCAALLEQQQALAMGLRRLASQRNGVEAPGRLEERLVDAFRAQTIAAVEVIATPAWPRRSAQVSMAAALMALAVLLIWQHPSQKIAAGVVPETVSSAELDSDFVPLPYAGDAGPAEDAALIRVEMPRSALIALGVPVADGDGGEPVEADVMLGLGGAPQAVRIVQ